jgi:hypothetical protein
VVWQHTAPLSDVHLDPDNRLPDVQRLNNALHVEYTVRPLIDFPRLDRYLLYPFVTLENNFIDGNIPRLHLIALYLDDQGASVSVGYKENPEELSLEGQLWRNRFPLPSMATRLVFSDRQSAYTLSLETSLLLEEFHKQQRLPANLFTLGYRVAFLQQLEEFHDEAVPDDFAPSTGRLHSFVLRYRRDTRIPPPVGAPLEVFAEPLAYGYALRLELELASELLGSTQPDFQQLRGEVSEYLRLWNQTWLQLRLFGGWSAGPIPLQRKLTLAGVDTVRGYPYRLRFLGDRMLGVHWDYAFRCCAMCAWRTHCVSLVCAASMLPRLWMEAGSGTATRAWRTLACVPALDCGLLPALGLAPGCALRLLLMWPILWTSAASTRTKACRSGCVCRALPGGECAR